MWSTKEEKMFFEWYTSNEHLFNTKEIPSIVIMVELQKFIDEVLKNEREKTLYIGNSN